MAVNEAQIFQNALLLAQLRHVVLMVRKVRDDETLSDEIHDVAKEELAKAEAAVTAAQTAMLKSALTTVRPSVDQLEKAGEEALAAAQTARKVADVTDALVKLGKVAANVAALIAAL
ncbi:hypothetical protein P3W85_14540 [Cupriavidus basilensis]|uniref:Uncharacterized protein n=1 Tax=Cupriavidus basilensis TaxID=68895 RepID=A0ABT6ANG5_9BURK|nr:hypothetical protein [Cupriavidus basilensis]MDF3834165.1 hypothetical protein [Cupriavidus basilensis]